MITRERLQELAGDINSLAWSPFKLLDEAQEMARALLALQWREITAEDLPKMGDEVISRFVGAGCRSVQREEWSKNYNDWIADWYAFRPISDPGIVAAPERTDKGEK